MVAHAPQTQPTFHPRIFIALQVLVFAMGIAVMAAICADPGTATFDLEDVGAIQMQQQIQSDIHSSIAHGELVGSEKLHLENSDHQEKDCMRSTRSKVVLFGIAAA